MENKSLTRTDLIVALALTMIMAVAFTLIGGRPLVVTFVVGLVGVAALLLWMFQAQAELPEPVSFYPVFFGTLAWQFIHFTEEFRTGFQELFPVLYGAEPFSADLFVSVNMVSYFGFSISCILVLSRNIRFLVAPMLFFIVYGAIGNAIAHTWWVILMGEYFPGFVTGLVYWILGPFALSRLIGSAKVAITFTLGFGLVLVSILTIFMQQ
ncbi:HXXEE domain-containing protein [Shimia haliotis]|uniref:HXXEE domain-containing protein n=1 Tax=Shimia haliotis TaxID=1280847 RepID=A0A1I4CRB5_9RHOB|nr:HXXEE domain-containing protein [Shimia haliotis]SFK82777.1 Protein of unknown function with HXXEE motif-containing protein [Shimia haliotis]